LGPHLGHVRCQLGISCSNLHRPLLFGESSLTNFLSSTLEEVQEGPKITAQNVLADALKTCLQLINLLVNMFQLPLLEIVEGSFSLVDQLFLEADLRLELLLKDRCRKGLIGIDHPADLTGHSFHRRTNEL